MAREVVVAHDRPYTVAFDEPRRRGDLFQSLVLAQLVDELTGNPVTGATRVTTDLAGAWVRTGRDGVAGLVGVPTRVFPALDAQPYAFDVRFEVDGYLPLVRAPITFTAQPTFPDTFADELLGAVPLRRRPVSLTVRTITPDVPNPPVAVDNATVRIAQVWRTLADLASAPLPADIVSLRPPLYAPRPQPATTFEPVTFNPVAEADRFLTEGVPAGAHTLAVSYAGTVGTNDVVGIDRTDPDRAEHIEVVNVIGPSNPASPATLVLAHPTQYAHRKDALVRAVTVVSLGPPAAHLTDDAFAGDPTVFVDTITPFAGVASVRISGGSAVDEYVTASPYEVVTHDGGYARFPPLTRVAAIRVEASATGPITAPATPFTPNYLVSENQLHLTLT